MAVIRDPRLRRRAQLARLVAAFPTVLGLSYDAKLAPTLRALRAPPWGLDDAALLRRVVLGSPSILGAAHATLERKRAFYCEGVVGASAHEFRRALARTPTLCNYSLERRVAPRRDALLAAGLHADLDELARVVKMTDRRFTSYLSSAKGRRMRQLPLRQVA